MKKMRSWQILLLAGIVVLAGIGGYYRWGPPAQKPLPSAPPPEVVIMEPLHGSQIPLGSPAPIEVRALAAETITALELWIDGQLLGYQAAADEQSQLFQTSFLWMPSNPGIHTLSARALGSQSAIAFSDAIHVEVIQSQLPADSDDLRFLDLPEVIPPAEDAVPIQGPGTSQSIPEAALMTAPPAAPGGQTEASSPAAPQLIAKASACGVELLIHDLSEDEQGFSIYRQASNTQSWTQVAQLEPNAGTGWISYTEETFPGGFTYYAASFNQGGESPSNLALVNIDPGDCPSSPTTQPALELDLQSLLGESGADRAYCYRTLDDMHWDRIPDTGNFKLNQQEGTLPVVNLISLAGFGEGLPEKKLNLQLDCWGWFGNQLEHLGNYSHSFDLTRFDTLPDQIGPSPFHEGLLFKPNSDAPTFSALGLDLGKLNLVELLDLFPIPFYASNMPYFYASVTHDPETCKQHLPPDAQNLLGQLLFCSPYPGFDLGPDGDNPQPYLHWDEQHECPLGGTLPCLSRNQWVAKAEEENGEVWFVVRDESSAGTYIWPIHSAAMNNWTIKPLDCAGSRQFHVTMYYADADEYYMGPSSNPFNIDCPRPVPWVIPLEISFDTIRFYNLDDGDNGEVIQDVEVYGYLLATTSQGNRFVNFAKWDQQADNCPDEVFNSVLNSGGYKFSGCTIRFEDLAPYDLSEAELCQSTSKYNCSIASWGFENNKVQLGIDDGDGIMLQVLIMDWDDASGNDLQCLAFYVIPARDRLEWAKVQDLSFTIDSPNWGSGSCQIKGSISAVVP